MIDSGSGHLTEDVDSGTASKGGSRPDFAERAVTPLLLITIRDLILTVFVVVIAFPLWALPWSLSRRLGRVYGWFVYTGWGVARRAGMINLRRAYGTWMDRRKAARWIRIVCAGLGQSVAEGIQFARRYKSPESPWTDLYAAEIPELEQWILADSRPKIFVTGHLGSWEAGLMMLTHRVGGRGAVIARRIDNPYLDRIVRRLSLAEPNQWIDKKGASEEALIRLRRGESVAMRLAENGGRRGPFIDFMGRPASTGKTPALLALMTGCPVVLGAALRRSAPQGHPPFLYRLSVFEPALYGTGSGAVVDLTRDIMKIYEGWVREDPLQWRWVHRCWQRRPDGTRETYTRADLRAEFEITKSTR